MNFKNQDKNPIFITRPSLPPLEEFLPYLEKIWDTHLLTNNGPFHLEFEKALADYLGVKYLSLLVNGTLALVTALQALHITGEVITTPFSFVATTHAIWWNRLNPVFVDIEPEYFNLDPEKIEAAITPRTTAIMPVHVFGNPCRVEEIQKIADTYGLKVIYDAAHAFGVKINGNSVLNYGDLSVLSFHATKTFNTIEGGAIISPDEKTKERIDLLKNFGFADEVTVVETGINGKMNEVQAAYGLVQLKHIGEYIDNRKQIAELYRSKLSDIEGIKPLYDINGINHSYAYFPVLIDSETYGETRDEVYERLKRNNIYARRYYYPLISQLPAYKELSSANGINLPVANKITRQVICLPIYHELNPDAVNYIYRLLRK